MQMEMNLLQPKLQDKLFNQTGIEYDDLDNNTIAHKLEEDPEYIKSLKEYGEKMDKLQSDQTS